MPATGEQGNRFSRAWGWHRNLEVQCDDNTAQSPVGRAWATGQKRTFLRSDEVILELGVERAGGVLWGFVRALLSFGKT